VVDRHEVMTDEEFLPLAATRAKRPELTAFRQKLRDLGYSEEAVTRTLGIEGPYALTRIGRELWPRYIIPGNEPISVLIRLFLLSLSEPEPHVRDVLGRDNVELLRDLKLLSPDGAGHLQSPIALYPVGSLFVTTDWWREPKGGPDTDPNRVMPLGRDSYGLARLIASFGGGDAVDLCTGSGVGALKAAPRFDRVLGVDINPRAINFARFNALLNDLDNCSFEQGDLYGPVGDRRFDLVTANPPFVPVPGATGLLYRDGGPSGEDVLREIVSGCPAHLKGHGVGIIVTDLVEHRGTSYEEKLTTWLGTGSGSTVAVLRRPAETIYRYATTHLSHTAPLGVSPAMFEWIDHYLAEGIEEVARGYIVIRPSTGPDRTIMTIPIEQAAGADVAAGSIEELLRRLETASSHRVSDLRFSPRFHPGKSQLLPEGEALAQVSLPYLVVRAMEAAARSEGRLSLDALVAAFRSGGYEVGPRGREELEHILRQLYVSGYLDDAPAQPGEAAGRVDRREAAMKLWWSR
jgi:SAM-dependent methyltransferase